MSEETFNFEKAFERLETILEKMNSGNVSLDESLKLYEEADQLIVACNSKLAGAEARIEQLMKKRSGELELDAAQKPVLQAFALKE